MWFSISLCWCFNRLQTKKAERVGFEPTVELPPLRFSRPACSTAPAPLRERIADLLFYVSEGDLRITSAATFCYSVFDRLSRGKSMKRATKSAAKLVVLENNDPISVETEEIQSRIRERAYELSKERGHAGREMDDWLTAESEIISVPQADLIERDGMFQVRFAIPAVDLHDVQVMTSSDQILVKADYQHEAESDEGTVHLRDFRSGTVFRSLRFPQPTDVNSVDVEYQDGVLRMTATKA